MCAIFKKKVITYSFHKNFDNFAPINRSKKRLKALSLEKSKHQKKFFPKLKVNLSKMFLNPKFVCKMYKSQICFFFKLRQGRSVLQGGRCDRELSEGGRRMDDRHSAANFAVFFFKHLFSNSQHLAGECCRPTMWRKSTSQWDSSSSNDLKHFCQKYGRKELFNYFYVKFQEFGFVRKIIFLLIFQQKLKHAFVLRFSLQHFI